MQDMKSEDYFPSFAWAVRKAFKEPLASCRFEQGDILYDTHKAYEGTWGDALNYLRFSIQIKSGSISKMGNSEDFAFSNNWRQRVELDLTEYPSKKSRFIITTQGRLYMTLWKGDLRQLDLDTPEPPVPKLAADILKELPSMVDFFKHHSKNLKHPVFFIMPFDETQDILFFKRQKVESSLIKEFKLDMNLVTPEKIGIQNSGDYVPTLRIACFITDTPEINKVYSSLKSALYVPSEERKTNVDRFRLESHGYLHPSHIS